MIHNTKPSKRRLLAVIAGLRRQLDASRRDSMRLAQQLAALNLERKRLKGIVLALQERECACRDIHEYIGRAEARHGT